MNEDDGYNIDLNIENELNKHFGFLSTPTGSTGSTSTTATGSTGTTSSATIGAGTPTTASTRSDYEKTPLDPNIVFDPWGYRCISNKAYENKERKPPFKKGYCLCVFANMKWCEIDVTIDGKMAKEFDIPNFKQLCVHVSPF